MKIEGPCYPPQYVLTVGTLLPHETHRAAEICYLARELRGEPHDYFPDLEEELAADKRLFDIELKDPATRIMTVKDADRTILGVTSYYKKNSMVICSRFYTLPCDKKPATPLMNYFQSDARAMGAKRLWLTAQTANAVGFYNHFGFSLIRHNDMQMEKYLYA